LGTLAITRSKCLHFADLWPRRQGSLRVVRGYHGLARGVASAYHDHLFPCSSSGIIEWFARWTGFWFELLRLSRGMHPMGWRMSWVILSYPREKALQRSDLCQIASSLRCKDHNIWRILRFKLMMVTCTSHLQLIPVLG
jgi:hypothetical protein